MTAHLTCDWCAAPIGAREEYSAEEYNRMGFEESADHQGRHVVVESRFSGTDRRAASRPSIVGHFHYPQCYQQALRLMQDHNAWAAGQGCGPAGAATPQWELGKARHEQPVPFRDGIDGTPLENLELDTRVMYTLGHEGVCSIEELAALTDEQLGAFHQVGPRRVAQIRQALVNHQRSSQLKRIEAEVDDLKALAESLTDDRGSSPDGAA